MMSLGIVYTLVSIALITALVFLYRRKCHYAENLKKMHSAVCGASAFDNLIRDVIAQIRNTMNTEVIEFLKYNRHTQELESGTFSVPLLQPSSVIRAFYTLKPVAANSECDIDKSVLVKLGAKKLGFIPIHKKAASPCWQINGCQDPVCPSRNNESAFCWLDSKKNYRGTPLKTCEDKTSQCIFCRAFLPIGVFVVPNTSRRRLRHISAFINETFTNPLTDALMYDRAVFTATQDSLTSIPNKRNFEQTLSSMYSTASRYKQDMSLSMFDIDHFKKFNDEHGHQTGDFVLRALAQLVSSSIRETDFIARYGGEEFAIIFSNTTKDTAAAVSEKIRKTVEAAKFKCDAGDFNVRISMGVASFPEDKIESPDDLIAKADTALMEAKKDRNKVVAFSSGMQIITKKSTVGPKVKKKTLSTEQDPKSVESAAPPKQVEFGEV